VLELPLFEPGVHYGSVYDYYQLQEAREQPGGYSTLAPQDAFDFYFRHDRLSCGVWLESDRAELARLGITRILFHGGLYAQAARRGAWFAWRGLQEQGFGPVARGGRVTLFAPGAPPGPEPVGEPPRGEPVLCSGWRNGRMTGREATIWAYGLGKATVELSGGMAIVFVDGRRDGEATELGWHSLRLVSRTSGASFEGVSFVAFTLTSR
jgi:hypothetical protein